ncbi:hypothetical protein T310_5850, partial [Rasamsonia emersonii CBS 393.64]
TIGNFPFCSKNACRMAILARPGRAFIACYFKWRLFRARGTAGHSAVRLGGPPRGAGRAKQAPAGRRRGVAGTQGQAMPRHAAPQCHRRAGAEMRPSLWLRRRSQPACSRVLASTILERSPGAAVCVLELLPLPRSR